MKLLLIFRCLYCDKGHPTVDCPIRRQIDRDNRPQGDVIPEGDAYDGDVCDCDGCTCIDCCPHWDA